MKKSILLVLMLASTQCFATITFVTRFPRMQEPHHDYRYAKVGIVKTNHVHRASPGIIHEDETIITHAKNVSIFAPDPSGEYNIEATCFNAGHAQSLPFKRKLTLADGATLNIKVECRLDHYGNPITPTLIFN